MKPSNVVGTPFFNLLSIRHHYRSEEIEAVAVKYVVISIRNIRRVKQLGQAGCILMEVQNSSFQDTVRNDLTEHIREEGHGAVTAIASQVRVSRQYLHEFLVGRDIGAAKLTSITEFLALKGFPGYEAPAEMSAGHVAEEHGRSTFSRDTMCMQCGQLTPAPPRGKFCCACGQRLAFQCPNANCGLWNILNTGVSQDDTIVCQRCGTALRGKT